MTSTKVQEIQKKAAMFEKELLGIILGTPNLSVVAKKLLSPDDFTYFPGQFDTIVDCYINQKSLAVEFLSKGWKLSDFNDEFSPRKVEAVCADIKQVSTARKVYGVLENATNALPIDGIDEFVSETHKGLVASMSDSAGADQTISALIEDFRSKQVFYKKKFESGNGIVGIPTGYPKLDEVIDGLRPGHLWIIGAYTSGGKTFASLNIAANLIKQGKRVVFYTIEMTALDILTRLLGLMTNQSGLAILKGYPHNEEKVSQALDLIEKSNLTIIAGSAEVSQLQFSVYEQILKAPVDLFVVDFLQLVTVKGSRSDYETTTAAILEIQNMANKFQSPFIVLSQVSNESAKYNDPVVMGFKGSGAIAAAADLAIEITSNEENKEIWKQKISEGKEVKMKWNIRKNRHGRAGYLDMLFYGKNGVFRDDDYKNDFNGF